MARRVIKPFAVEIRGAGRRGKLQSAGTISSVPIETEQPRVTGWPGIDPEPAGLSHAPEPALAAAVVPAGRVLPVLDEPAAPEPVVTRRKQRRALDVAESAPETITEEPAAPAVSVIDVAPAAAMTPRKDRARLARETFKRSDRWRARLPASVHRGRERGS